MSGGEPIRPTAPDGPARPAGGGWRALREEREREFRIDFAPLRRAIRRNELFSAMVELFVGAVVGVTKLNLEADDPTPDEQSGDGRSGAASESDTDLTQTP